MALLNKERRRSLHSRLGLLALGLFAASCALVTALSGSGTPFGFSHRQHAAEGLECGDCHLFWDSEDAPGMPTLEGCNLCHESIDEEKPPEKRIEQLFDDEGRYKARRVSELDDEVIFSHLQHATKPIECNACHAGIAENDYVDESLAQSMADCTSCHEQQAVANDCATCHQLLRKDVAPDSHAFQWQRAHGGVVRAESALTVNDCSLCHAESSCSECHLSTPPENHNNFFRLRGHGLYARMDRQNCTACHRTDSCTACHAVTRPLNHNGSFGAGQSTHCLGCHLPIENSECYTCHKGAPSHAMATPKPPDHSPGMNCRLCHGMGQSLPHVDKGDDCNICHR